MIHAINASNVAEKDVQNVVMPVLLLNSVSNYRR